MKSEAASGAGSGARTASVVVVAAAAGVDGNGSLARWCRRGIDRADPDSESDDDTEADSDGLEGEVVPVPWRCDSTKRSRTVPEHADDSDLEFIEDSEDDLANWQSGGRHGGDSAKKYVKRELELGEEAGSAVGPSDDTSS